MNKDDGIIGMVSGIIFIALAVLFGISSFPFSSTSMGLGAIFGILGTLLLFAGAVVYDICVGIEKEKKY